MSERRGRTRVPSYTISDAVRLAREVEMLRRVGVLLNHLDNDEAAVFREIVAVLRAYYNVDRMTILLADSRPDVLLAIDADELGAGGEPKVDEVKSEISPFADVIRLKRSVIVENRHTLDEDEPLAAHLEADGSRSVVAIPLSAARKTIGALVLSSYQTLAFRANDVATLEVLGTLVGSVLDSLRVFRTVAASQREMQAIFDHFEEAIAVIDRGHKVVRVNQTLRDRVGRSYAEILDRPATEILSDLDANRVQDALEVAFSSGEEVAWTAPGGPEAGPVEMRISPLTTGSTGVERVVARLGQSAEGADIPHALDTVLGVVGDAVLVATGDGSIRAATPRVAELLGRDRAELLGTWLPDLLDELGVDDETVAIIREGQTMAAPAESSVQREGATLRLTVRPAPAGSLHPSAFVVSLELGE